MLHATSAVTDLKNSDRTAAGTRPDGVRKKHAMYSDKDRATIGRDTCENGNEKAR